MSHAATARFEGPRRALMAACLLLGLADLAFIDGVALPRVLGGERSLDEGRPRPAAPTLGERSLDEGRPPPTPEDPPREAPPLSPTPALALTIHFASADAALNARARASLDALVAKVSRHPGWTFAVEGHADARGDAALNDRLSEERAQAVAAHLEAAGLPASRLQTAAFGATRPAARGDEAAALRRNRRVEILIVRGGP